MSAAILVVDDQPAAAQFLRLLLEQHGHQVATAGHGVEALGLIEEKSFDLVLTDLDMPEMDGLELMHRVRQRWPALPVVAVTALSDVSKVVEVVQLGAIDYLLKPAQPAAVLATVRKALASRPKRDVPRTIPELVGRSRPILEIRHLVTLAAGSGVPVLITGETGTGKELVARAIHRYSHLAEGPFVSHNCAVMPRDLFESAFFGHRRGAFTGADRDHAGLLVEADRGVLFLDEVQALLYEHQAKLLRVLDDGEVTPVGGTRSRQVNVRFLAATNRDPRRMIEEGTLREDLYYRLRGFEIDLPPLRDRRGDIPMLAAHFLGDRAEGFSPDALEALGRAPWPGNIRQLRNAVLAAAAASQGARIGLRHLALDRESAPAPLASAGDGGADALRGTLRDIERRAILRALEDAAGNRSAAARSLGVDRSTLRRKMKEYDIEEEG